MGLPSRRLSGKIRAEPEQLPPAFLFSGLEIPSLTYVKKMSIALHSPSSGALLVTS